VHAADTAFVLFDSAWSLPKIALHEEHQIGLADECGRRSSADQPRGLAVLRPVIYFRGDICSLGSPHERRSIGGTVASAIKRISQSKYTLY
jgi:hypothetical protein